MKEVGIRINSLSPGVIRTPLTMAEGQKAVTDRLAARIPQGRLGESEEIARTVTEKGEPFKGHDVSLNSLSELIAKLTTTPALHVRESLGVSRVKPDGTRE